MSICSIAIPPVHSGPRHGLLEGIEVHDDEIDGEERVRLHGAHVGRVIATMEDSGVDPGVEGLHPSVEHLGEPGEGLDGRDPDARGLEGPGGPAGREDLDAELPETAGKLEEAGLVRDAEDRAADGMSSGMTEILTALARAGQSPACGSGLRLRR